MSTGRGSMESRGLPLRSCRAPDVDSCRNWDGNFVKRQVRVGYGCYGVYQVYIIKYTIFSDFFHKKDDFWWKSLLLSPMFCIVINFAEFGWDVPSIAWWITTHGRSMKKPYGSQVTHLVLFLQQKNTPIVVVERHVNTATMLQWENDPSIVKNHLCIDPLLYEQLLPETLMTCQRLGHDVWACRSLQPGQRWELEHGVVARWICWISSYDLQLKMTDNLSQSLSVKKKQRNFMLAIQKWYHFGPNMYQQWQIFKHQSFFRQQTNIFQKGSPTEWFKVSPYFSQV